MSHGLDTDKQVFFYEQEFYPLSNFSSFTLLWKRHLFYTSEHAYHWEKFPPQVGDDITGSGEREEAPEKRVRSCDAAVEVLRG